MAWDGRRIIDRPESLKVEDGDRGHKKNSNLAFVKLSPPSRVQDSPSQGSAEDLSAVASTLDPSIISFMC